MVLFTSLSNSLNYFEIENKLFPDKRKIKVALLNSN